MSSPAYSRKKEPERVRQALIDGAAALVAERGLANVTVAAVAAGAGVTKGALFHHFADKNALIAAMFEDLLAKLDVRLESLMAADPIVHGRFTRAYVNSSLSFGDDWRVWIALLGSLTALRAYIVRWHEWVDGRLAAVPSERAPMLEVVRTAADGAWFMATTESSPIDMARMRQNLIELTLPAN